MKKTILATILSACTLTPFVIAACPSPNLPWCPVEVELIDTDYVEVWTCCDQTKACSTNGTKYPRFERAQSVALYVGADLQLHPCVYGGYIDGPEINCCD